MRHKRYADVKPTFTHNIQRRKPPVILSFLTTNFMTLMILSGLIAVIIMNRDSKLPASDLFFLSIALLFAVIISDWLNDMATIQALPFSKSTQISIKTAASAMSYIIRPFIIFTELLIILPGWRYKALFAIPAAVNTVVYSTAFTGSHIAFYTDQDLFWHRGPLGTSVYFSQLFYVLFLAIYSIRYFKNNSKRSIIIFAIIIQTLIVAYVEYQNILSGHSNDITALCMFEYYAYLCVVYQREMRDAISQRDLRISQDKMLILRNQIQPHFIYNCLAIIRSLAKRDGYRAVECIDNFSDYLKAHIGAIQTDSPVPFEKELYNVKVYLSLVQADSSRDLIVFYDTPVTDFDIPPLSLEPIVENAVNHGISHDNGRISIITEKGDGCVLIRISDNGSAKKTKDANKPIHTGIGIENTRKRLEVLCGGELEMNITDHGTTVVITIPDNKTENGDENENTDS